MEADKRPSAYRTTSLLVDRRVSASRFALSCLECLLDEVPRYLVQETRGGYCANGAYTRGASHTPSLLHTLEESRLPFAFLVYIVGHIIFYHLHTAFLGCRVRKAQETLVSILLASYFVLRDQAQDAYVSGETQGCDAAW